TGRAATAWTCQPVEPALVHRRLDRRDLGDLMPQRLGVLAVEVVAAAAARRRLAVDDLPEPLRRDQGPAAVAVAGLAAPLPARGATLGWPLHRGGIGRWRPGGVGGVGL